MYNIFEWKFVTHRISCTWFDRKGEKWRHVIRNVRILPRPLISPSQPDVVVILSHETWKALPRRIEQPTWLNGNMVSGIAVSLNDKFVTVWHSLCAYPPGKEKIPSWRKCRDNVMWLFYQRNKRLCGNVFVNSYYYKIQGTNTFSTKLYWEIKLFCHKIIYA